MCDYDIGYGDNVLYVSSDERTKEGTVVNIDENGHVWVVDSVNEKTYVFSRDRVFKLV
ncbi:MAG: hypothetical protein ACRCST_03095 [Turicibacter sp.]